MAASFLALPATVQAEILNAKSKDIGLPATVLEKDIWICWLLKHLFEMPDGLPMVFKGGTSLSKVYSVIQRMSEDLDLTIDTTAHFPKLDSKASSSKVKKQRADIETFVSVYIAERIVSHLRQQCISQFGREILTFSMRDKESISVAYPRSAERASYLKDTVILEFGGRNLIEPNNTFAIRCYIDNPDLKLELPVAKVAVLAAERTFWEKVTLVHAECHRQPFRKELGYFRHWYDLSKLVKTEFGQRAALDYVLLTSVVETKSLLYSRRDANYEACLEKRFKLLPDSEGLKILQADFNQMVDAGMFFSGEDPSFRELIESIKILENDLNKQKNTLD